MLGLGVLSVIASFFMSQWYAVLGLQILGGTLAVFALGQMAQAWVVGGRRKMVSGALMDLIQNDAVPSYLCDPTGLVIGHNAASGPGPEGEDTLTARFADVFANPTAVLFRIQSRADAEGAVQEVISTRRGRVRLSVTSVTDGNFIWRVEHLDEAKAGQDKGQEGQALPMLTAGPSGTILYMNDSFRRLVGKRPRALSQVFSDLPLVSGRMHRIQGAAGEVSATVAIVSGSGGRQEVFLIPGNDNTTGDAPSGLATWDAIEDLPVPLLKVARTGEVLASNREARSLVGQLGEGTRLSDLLEGLGRPIIDWLQEVANGQRDGDSQFLRGRGEKQDFFVQVSLNAAGEGDDRHLVAVLNDMTEFKSLEAQFVQSQKMQAIGQLAGGVAHDFNNLLTAISGHCDLLLLRHDQGDQDYSDLIQIHQNANRAASLVGQLLAFSRKQNLRPEVIDLRDTLADLTHLLNRLVGEKVKLLLNHDPDLMPIRADKRQLEQVIMNLVVNARDAMPSGGEIRVETENLTLTEPLNRDRAKVPAGEYVMVRVIDEGMGIRPEKITKIFEPFYTTKRTGEGTGLGLSTAYGIVKQTGGFIFADSEVGTGSVFTLYFPVHDQTIADPAPETPVFAHRTVAATPDHSLPDTMGGGVVLLVEDEAPVRAFASRALRLRGYTVLEADSAETALEMLEDEGLHVDIFVTDVIMPGKDGPTWVREALQSRPDTRVVFVSGYAEDAFGENEEAIPNSVFLPKPFSLNELTSTVRGQLH